MSLPLLPLPFPYCAGTTFLQSADYCLDVFASNIRGVLQAWQERTTSARGVPAVEESNCGCSSCNTPGRRLPSPTANFRFPVCTSTRPRFSTIGAAASSSLPAKAGSASSRLALPAGAASPTTSATLSTARSAPKNTNAAFGRENIQHPGGGDTIARIFSDDTRAGSPRERTV